MFNKKKNKMLWATVSHYEKSTSPPVTLFFQSSAWPSFFLGMTSRLRKVSRWDVSFCWLQPTRELWLKQLHLVVTFMACVRENFILIDSLMLLLSRTVHMFTFFPFSFEVVYIRVNQLSGDQQSLWSTSGCTMKIWWRMMLLCLSLFCTIIMDQSS